MASSLGASYKEYILVLSAVEYDRNQRTPSDASVALTLPWLFGGEVLSTT
jgi:hypothetical protein